MVKIEREELLKLSLKQNILIIDDDEDMQLILTKRLKKFFHHLDSAYNGKDGLKKYRERKYHIILCDIRMPKMDGLNFLEELRKEDLEQKVIFMSAYNDSYYFRELINSGADGFILKPVEFDKLLNIIYKNSKAVFQQEEHIKNVEEIKRLYRELEDKNTELTKTNLKFRYIYKRISDKLKRDINPIVKEHKKSETTLSKLPKRDFSKSSAILNRAEISAKEYLEKIEFFNFNAEFREDLQIMSDFESDLKDIIDSTYESKIITEQLIQKIVTLFLKYQEVLSILVEFDIISESINSLIETINKIDYDKLNENSELFLDYIYFLVEDLQSWREEIFIKQSAPNIHYLDDSFMNNCQSLEQYILGKNDSESKEDDDIFFF